MKLDGKIPAGSLAEKWTKYRSTVSLVAPHNKMRLEVIVIGSGLAGASAAATLGELGYNVKCFTFHD
ncbi:MAG TPA: FAD-binding protein, partial [Saprospiraceae bacterium]|nr:FAD-binding protein [Saprospiraceae bacterium]